MAVNGDENKIEDAQRLLEEIDVDFVPVALELLNALKDNLDKARAGEDRSKAVINMLAEPVMELKSRLVFSVFSSMAPPFKTGSSGWQSKYLARVPSRSS